MSVSPYVLVYANLLTDIYVYVYRPNKPIVPSDVFCVVPSICAPGEAFNVGAQGLGHVNLFGLLLSLEKYEALVLWLRRLSRVWTIWD